MRLISFAARCQRVDIKTQYLKYGVRCFDLRVRLDEFGRLVVAHGPVIYTLTINKVFPDLDWLNGKGDCYVRVLHETRTKSQYKEKSVKWFGYFCNAIQETYPNIQFWCGRNLYNWKVDYQFEGEEPTCEETYGSVVPGKKWLYGWWPWLYAVTHNKAIKAKGTDKDILLIDFVDVG
jgi:hypothetical protein